MRKIIISAVVATVAAVSFAAPSNAGGYGYGHRHYGGHYGYQTHCFVKKVRTHDYYGNRFVKRVRVCR